MKKVYFFFCMLLCNVAVYAQVLTEDFSYTAGTLITANGWTAHSGAGTNAITVTTPGLTYPGHAGSGVGNAISMTTNGEDDNRTFAGITSGSVYTSFLINVSAAQATGDYCIGLFTTSALFPLRVYIKSTAGGFFFGLAKGSVAPTYESTVRSLSTTYFIVADYIYNTGTGTDDVVNLWVNPALGGLEGAATIPNVNGAFADATTIIASFLRQGSAGNASTQRIDAIRVGTTWASVTPPVIAPTTQALNITFSNVQSTQFDFNWTDGNGSSRAVFIAAANSGTATPADNTTYAANTAFSTGTQIGATGWYCVYNSSAAHATPTTINGLTANTTYRVMVCEYNGNAGSEAYNSSIATNNPLNQATLPGGALTPPTLTPAAGATVDANFNITFTDDATWRAAVTTVKYGAATLTPITDYSFAAGILTLKPTGGNAALHVAGTQTVTVSATGYSDATVSQFIGFGAPNKLGIGLQPTSPAINGAVLGVQPTVAVQDQYGNTITTSSSSITAIVGAGAWTIGGTTNQNAVAGIATFTDLTATSVAFVSGATIDFISVGLTHILSAPFNIPGPPTTYTWNASGTGSWATATNWTPNGIPATNDAVIFSGSSPVTITDVPSVSLYRLSVTGTGAVTLQATGAVIVNVGGGSSPQFNISSGSSLILDGPNAITINILTGNTGTVSGAVTLQGGGHRLTSAIASGITFNSGGSCLLGTGFSGNPFGPSGSTANSIVFGSGSTFIQQAGSNPFASTQPASIVVFQTGSLFKLQGNLTPSLSGRTYGNFELDFATAVISGTGAAALNIDNLTVSQGSLSLGMTGTFNIKGNISVAPGATLNFAPATSGTLTLNGGAAQSISNSGTLSFGPNQSVTVNNSNGVTLNTSVTLGVSGTFTLTSGKVTLGSNNLSAPFVAGGSGSNYVVTNGTGALTITNISSGSGAITFPVGPSNLLYHPATITNTGTTDDFSVKVASVAPGCAPSNKSVTATWDIAEALAGGSNCTISLDYTGAATGVNFTTSGAQIIHCTGGTADYHNGSITGTVATGTGFTVFSPFGITNDAVVLPVDFISVKASQQTGGVKVEWTNLTETDIASYVVEHSADGRSFTNLSLVNPISNNGGKADYTYLDVSALDGVNYYRINAKGINGSSKYSIIVKVNTKTGHTEITIYPNPVTGGQLSLQATDLQKGQYTIRIINAAGQQVFSQSLLHNGGAVTEMLQLPATIKSGMYNLQLSGGDVNLSRTFIVR